MKKRILSILLALAALLSLVSCAGTGNAEHQADVTLTLMGKQSDLGKSYITSVISQYEKATGNRIRLIAYEDAQFETEAVRRFSGGWGAPDLLMHFNDAELNDFDVPSNFCYLNDQPWASDLTDGASAYCQDGEGNLLGLPFWESSVSGCYYNKTLLDSLGLRQPATQAEFDMLCQTLADTGCTPICWPADGCTWMFQFGLDPIFADDPDLLDRLNRHEVSYADIPAVTDMVQWIADAADQGWFGDNYLSQGWSDISPMLGSGEAAMVFIWDTWFYTDFEEGNTYSRDDFALMPAFMNTVPNGTYEGGNLNMMMVNKNSAQKDEALEFLAFCADPEHYNVAFDGISTVSCFNGQTTNIQSQMVTDAADSIAANERVSTAAVKIVGYSAENVSAAFAELFNGRTDVAGCVKLMDDYRLAATDRQGGGGEI